MFVQFLISIFIFFVFFAKKLDEEVKYFSAQPFGVYFHSEQIVESAISYGLSCLMFSYLPCMLVARTVYVYGNWRACRNCWGVKKRVLNRVIARPLANHTSVNRDGVLVLYTSPPYVPMKSCVEFVKVSATFLYMSCFSRSDIFHSVCLHFRSF